MNTLLIPVVVTAVRKETLSVVTLELQPTNGEPLPAFSPGAHIDLHLQDGLIRSYSLINESDGKSYTVAVLKNINGNGGSRYVHERLHTGVALEISHPRNHFKLNEGGSKSVLIAGGIGVTPIWAMRNWLLAKNMSMSLLYCARSSEEAAFYSELRDTIGVSIHLDTERGGAPDLFAYLKDESPDSDFYCCGPAPMLSAFETACKKLGFKNVHLERFAAEGPIETAQKNEYEVTLASTGRIIKIASGTSLLETLENSGVKVDSACREGICGTCETRVLAGTPLHRDSILSDEERNSNTTMMICVSGCAGRSLVLDL